MLQKKNSGKPSKKGISLCGRADMQLFSWVEHQFIILIVLA